jgi:D-alanine transaminase/branched-chain amino acid aminotransferase
MHCYFNGGIIPVEQASVKINDLSLLRGYGLFDYFRTYNGIPFQWDWYWARFSRSAEVLRWLRGNDSSPNRRSFGRVVSLG